METKRFELFMEAARRIDRDLGLGGPILIGRVAEECGMGEEEAFGHLTRAIQLGCAYQAGRPRRGEFLLEVNPRGF